MIKGMLGLEALRDKVAHDEMDTVVVAFSDHYGRLMGKRFDAEYFLESIALQGTHGCDYLLTTDAEMNPVPGYQFANWELGYGDFHMLPDLKTLRVASWLDKSALVLCDLESDKTHQAIAVAPRSILKEQLKQAEAMGFEVMAASELEYYLFNDSYKAAFQGGYRGLEPAGWYLEDYNLLQGSREEGYNQAIRRHLRASGIPVENSKGEWGLGQHEMNVRYAEALTMADNHSVYKQCLKEVADQQGISITFMAKYAAGQAGSSCHIHMSLWQAGKNIFAGDESFGPIKCSKTFKYFLGGLMKFTPDVMTFYAPTINSYKRYEDGSWAPTRIAWSYDNRTAGYRVVGKGQSLRIECRIPGADCNPYLAYAAMLASGMEGIRQQITAPEIFQGDIYAAQHLPRVPYSLHEAIPLFSQSPFSLKAFGKEVIEHYHHFFNSERKAFDTAVTDWERKRYFERI
ncbi:MAG: glutamine synthetase family protein [Deinococcales bacterium]